MTEKEKDEAVPGPTEEIDEADAQATGEEAQVDGSPHETVLDAGPGIDLPDEARVQIAELGSRLLRLQADFENYRRRVAKEKEELAAYANQKLLLGFLPVLDNLDRALGTPATQGDEKLRQGVEMTARSFREVLAREGVVAIEALGVAFDPNQHEAVMTVDSAEHADGTVVSEFQKGYKLADRVIRPSMVQVSKKG